MTHRKFPRFSYRGKCNQYTGLPFGYRLSSISGLMRRGMRLLCYLDALLGADFPETALHHTRGLIEFLEGLGLVVNFKRSTLWPVGRIVCLGLRLDVVSVRATLPEERWAKLITVLAHFSPGKWMTYHTIGMWLGVLSAARQVVPLGMLFMRRLQRWYASLYSK